MIDDRLLRIGSSNLNNRSLGFDSECDVAFEAVAAQMNSAEAQREILRIRDGLASEHLGVSVEEFRESMESGGTFLHAVEALRGTGRSLRALTETMVEADASPFAENDLMDPDHVPPSIAESALKLLESVVLWPLRHSIIATMYRKFRGS
jgi:phospholipase D1/2